MEPSGTVRDTTFGTTHWSVVLGAANTSAPDAAEALEKLCRADRFSELKTFLPGELAKGTYAEVAARLGLAEGTIKWEMNQLKKRYRELLLAEIAHTVSSPDQIDDEARHLIAVLSG